MGWKELNAGICRIMQDHCGAVQERAHPRGGVRLLRGLAQSEAQAVRAANPHELTRTLECLSLLTAGEAVMQRVTCAAGEQQLLGFRRIDFPAVDPPEWRKLLPIRKAGDGVAVREQPLD